MIRRAAPHRHDAETMARMAALYGEMHSARPRLTLAHLMGAALLLIAILWTADLAQRAVEKAAADALQANTMGGW